MLEFIYIVLVILAVNAVLVPVATYACMRLGLLPGIAPGAGWWSAQLRQRRKADGVFAGTETSKAIAVQQEFEVDVASLTGTTSSHHNHSQAGNVAFLVMPRGGIGTRASLYKLDAVQS